jgi:hypothetical protein
MKKMKTISQEEYFFIDGTTIEQWYQEYKARPLYQRFFVQLKQFWNRYI